MLPVHTQSTQVEYGDADRCLLQEGKQLTQEETEQTVGKGPAHRQELHNNTHTHTFLTGQHHSTHWWCVINGSGDILVAVISITLNILTETQHALFMYP